MNTPKGTPLILCRCDFPLYVQQKGSSREPDRAEEARYWRQRALDDASMPGELVEPLPIYDTEAIQDYVFKWKQPPVWTADKTALEGECPKCRRKYRIEVIMNEFNEVDFDPFHENDGGLMMRIKNMVTASLA